jgi:hypothetical protein
MTRPDLDAIRARIGVAHREHPPCASEDVTTLLAYIEELEAECERRSTLAAKAFNALIANDIAQMRAYGLSYEGVRALLGDFDDGDITFAKLMDLIRAAARAMAEEECAALRREIAELMDDH